MIKTKEKDGGERGVGKGNRVKLKHKGEGGDRGREEEAAGRKVKMFEEKEREVVKWKRGRRKT